MYEQQGESTTEREETRGRSSLEEEVKVAYLRIEALHASGKLRKINCM